MSVLDGFFSAWSSARENFGAGTPRGGAEFDASNTLSSLQTTLQASAPGESWTGVAASAYDAANTRQLSTITTLAVLDQRLGAYLDQSAQVVSTGRANLDAVKQWVIDAASSVPAGANSEAALLPIVAKGLTALQEIVTKTNGDMARVGDLLDKLSGEYDDTGGKRGEEVDKAPDDEAKSDEEKKADEEQASRDKLDEILEEYQVAEDPGGMKELNMPAWVDAIYRKATGSDEDIPTKELTAKEVEMLAANPWKIPDVFKIQDQASKEAVERFPPPTSPDFPDGREIDNQTDAFRHAYANALMTQKFGEEWAREFATAHEGRTGNWASSEAMDLYNNEIGRQVAVNNPDASPEELATLVEQAVRNGDTVVIRPDGKGLEWSNRIPTELTGKSENSGTVDGKPQPGY